MFPTVRRLAAVAAALVVAGSAVSAAPFDRDRAFFQRIEGDWSGPGEIVAGKYKGTKFICNFVGSAHREKIGLALDGGCRVGVFNQDMSARVERSEAGFRGTFLDGAAGKGLDVVGGTVKDEHVVFAIERSQLTGAMRAQLTGDHRMTVTISVHVGEELVPVIGVTLNRVDAGAVGAVTAR